MKEMTIKDVQTVCLNIMKDIHNFCKKNHIKYTLQGGSLLGAVRHNGFIPWDDDLDIAMPRPDYERFVNSYKSEFGYRLFSREINDDSNVLLAFSRICDMKDTFVDDSSMPWVNVDTGVWVDVFPLDAVEDNYDICFNRIKKLSFIWHKSTILRRKNLPFSKANGFIGILKYIARHIITPFLSFNSIDEHILLCKQIKWGETQYYSNLAFLGYGIKERHRIAVIESVRLMNFEDTEFFVMVGYDEALREKFGDYMLLPPESERVGRHGFNKYYWK